MTHQFDRLSPAQLDIAAELLSISTGMNCFEDAVLVMDRIRALVDAGEQNVTIIRWLSLLPRARAKRAADEAEAETAVPVQQLTLLTPLAGRSYIPAAHRLRDPEAPQSKPGSRAERAAMRRPETGLCVDCGAEFQMNPFGRPATRCEKHRSPNPSRQETASA